MNLDRIKIRGSVRSALAWLTVSWAALAIAGVLGLWQVAFITVLCAAWGIGNDVAKEGYFHPVLVYGFFALLVVLIDMAWIAAFMDSFVPFFSYNEYVDSNSMFAIAREHMTLFTATYVGYLLVRGLGKRRFELVTVKKSREDSLWLVFYLVGIVALVVLIVLSGGIVEVVNSLGNKAGRAAGRGELVLLQYFAYVGALIWFKKNIALSAFQRYGGLIALNLPLLLSGSRTGVLVSLIAAGYMDEKVGRRINLKAAALLGSCLGAFFAVYQAFRSQPTFDILSSLLELPTAIYKDLSMGSGYLIALQQGVIDSEMKLGVIWLTLNPFIPSTIRESFDLPQSPNDVFTQYLFPGLSTSTFSMGVMGEANYILSPGLSFLYYLAIGVILAWVGSFGWKKSLLLGAVVAGGTVRIVKGGITAGGAEILMLALPLLVVYLVATIVYGATKQKRPGAASG